jgi:hypothetical protein
MRVILNRQHHLRQRAKTIARCPLVFEPFLRSRLLFVSAYTEVAEGNSDGPRAGPFVETKVRFQAMVRLQYGEYQLDGPNWLYVPVVRRLGGDPLFTIVFEPCPSQAAADAGARRFFECIPEFMSRWGQVKWHTDGTYSVQIESEPQSQSAVYQIAELVEQMNKF